MGLSHLHPHATRMTPTHAPHSHLHTVYGISLDPAPQVLCPHSRLTGQRPGHKLQRDQEQAEAGPWLAQAPVASHPGEAHAQGGGPDGAAAGRGDSSGPARSLGGRLQSGSAGDWTDPARAAPCAPATAGRGWREAGDPRLEGESLHRALIGRLGPQAWSPLWPHPRRRSSVTPSQP
jgi:hypothetical protein